MTVFTKTGQFAQRLARGLINHLWVQPLETRIIPRLSKEKPGRVQSRLLRLSVWSANAGRVLLEELRLSVIRWAGPDWSVTYIGNGFSAEGLVSILFPETPETRESSPVYLWQVPGLVRKFVAEGDLVVCELNRIIHLAPKGVVLSFTIPQWIKQVIEGVDRSAEEVFAGIDSHTRREIRRLKSQNYSYITTHSEADFELFYYRMLLPYLAARYGGRGAIVRDYDFIHSSFAEGNLLIVQQDGEPISGFTFRLKGDTCEGLELGVINGRLDLVTKGCNVAMWWYVLNWAHEHGAHRFDLGSSRPMTGDGVFKFKRRFGGKVTRFWKVYSQWNFFGKDIPSPLRDFLNEKGFISEISGGHYQVILLDPSGAFDESKLAKQLKDLSKYGLAGVILLSGKGEQQLIPCTAVEVDPGGSPHLAFHKAPAN